MIITDKAIYYFDTDRNYRKAYYKDIVRAVMPEDKFTDNVLRVKMKDGSYFLLPIRRFYEGAKFSNLFGFIRFINRVVLDLEAREKSKYAEEKIGAAESK